MITFFTTAKSFLGLARVRQYNAIRSWKHIHPDAEVLLFGDGEGYEEAARELGMERVAGVLTSKAGVPRIDSMFDLVRRRARFPVRAYLNCDIILSGDLLKAVDGVAAADFLMVAQRHELTVGHEISFTPEAGALLARRVKEEGMLQDPSAIDMFLYRGDIWAELPELVVGRGGYDNFLIFYCRRKCVPVIDATEKVMLIHQSHDYGHLAEGSREVFHGEDARSNFQKAGVVSNLFTIAHADWRLTAKGMIANRCRGDWELWARSNRSLLGQMTRRNSSWRAVLIDMLFEFTLRCQPDYQHRMMALMKYPYWVFLRMIGRR
jgi:hypothetical protein